MEQIKIIEMNEMQLGFFESKVEDQDYRDKMLFAFCELNDVMPSELKLYYYFYQKETHETAQTVQTYILLCEDDILPNKYNKLDLEKGKYLTFLVTQETLKKSPKEFKKTVENYLVEHHYRLDSENIVYLAQRQEDETYRVFIAIG